MDTTDPAIHFDSDGNCSHCSEFINRRSKHKYNGAKSDVQLKNIIEKTGLSEEDARKSLARMNNSGSLIPPLAVAGVVMELLRDSAAHGREVRMD